MNHHPLSALLLPLLLLFSYLLALTTAKCDACTSFSAALTTCQKSSTGGTNVTALGTAMDTDSIHCMCSTSSNAAQMNTCNGCLIQDPLSVDVDITVLLAWSTTCKADKQFGEEQATRCWEGQPGDYVPCVSRSEGSGGDLDPTALGTSPATSATQTSSPSANPRTGAAMAFASVGLGPLAMIVLGVIAVGL